MPVERAGSTAAGGDLWRVAGRVVASLSEDTLLVSDAFDRFELRGGVGDCAPGDLVRAEAVRETPEGAAIAVYRADSVERVFRPTRAPWSAGSETGALVGNGRADRLVLRARTLEAIRRYFAEQRFLEVETPLVVTSPGLDLHLQAFPVERPYTLLEPGPDQSGRRASFPPPATLPFGYLITSPEYHMKRLLAGGVPRCFQFARCFRADERGARHEPEFTMLEWYRAWADEDAMVADTEAVLRAAAAAVGTPGVLRAHGGDVALDGPFERLTVREAFARYAPAAGDPIELARRDEERFYAVLVERIEPQLGRGRPTFLMRYPASQASLARVAPDDPTVCERFELYARGVELCNAFVELTDPAEQRRRLERDQRERGLRGLPVYPIDERFLSALEEGMPPSVGNALGLERLLMLATGRPAIADVMAFPHERR